MPNAIASKDEDDSGKLLFLVNTICTAQARIVVAKAQTSLTYSPKKNSVTKYSITDDMDRQSGAILLERGIEVYVLFMSCLLPVLRTSIIVSLFI